MALVCTESRLGYGIPPFSGGEVEADRTPWFVFEGPHIRLREEQIQYLSVIGERWGLVALWALCKGLVRFNAIQRACGINPNTLRQRLMEFEALGIVERKVIADVRPAVQYSLTEKGRDLIEIIRLLEVWIERCTSGTDTGDAHTRALIQAEVRESRKRKR